MGVCVSLPNSDNNSNSGGGADATSNRATGAAIIPATADANRHNHHPSPTAHRNTNVVVGFDVIHHDTTSLSSKTSPRHHDANTHAVDEAERDDEILLCESALRQPSLVTIVPSLSLRSQRGVSSLLTEASIVSNPMVLPSEHSFVTGGGSGISISSTGSTGGIVRRHGSGLMFSSIPVTNASCVNELRK